MVEETQRHDSLFVGTPEGEVTNLTFEGATGAAKQSCRTKGISDIWKQKLRGNFPDMM